MNPISYASKDYNAIIRETLSRIPQLTPDWTDHNPSDLGMTLLELFAGVTDMLGYYQEAMAGEAFLPTARQRQNIINLCKLIGYRLRQPNPATTVIRFSLGFPLSSDFTIPTAIKCRGIINQNEVYFETTTSGTIHHGKFHVDVNARQGFRQSEEFSGTGGSLQQFSLQPTDIAEGSIQVTIGDQAWAPVSHFQASDSNSHHFIAEANGLDDTSILFGNGVNGSIPPAHSTINVSYLRTLGETGNLGRNLVNEIITPIYHDGSRITLFVTNPVPATGGSPRESTQQARAQAPATIQTLWKAVTKQDFLSLALGFPGVGKVQVIDTNDCESVRLFQVNLVVAPEGGGQPSPQLLNDLAAFLEVRKVINVEINLYEPRYRPINIEAEIFSFGRDLGLVKSRIEQVVRDHFNFEKVSFGKSVYFSDLDALLDGVREVSHVHLILPEADTDLTFGELSVLGDLILNMRRPT